MHKSILATVALLAAITSASAQTTCNKIGTTTYCNGQAVSATSQPIGGTTFINRLK